MTEDSNSALSDALITAMHDTEVRLQFTFAFSASGTRHGVLIEHRSGYRGRWTKHPYSVFPNVGETVADVMHLLASIREEKP